MEKELLKKFIEIPSHVEVNKNFNEKKVADFVCSYFKKNLKTLNLLKIEVEKDRYNILALPQNPKVIFCCHLDTVVPSKKNHSRLEIHGDKAYGLGTKDMKGGWVASILSVLESKEEDQQKVGFLFYCDEEYSQKGIVTMANNSSIIPPSVKYLISPESRFNLLYGCRGYATVNLKIFGKKAHSSRPKQGINSGEVLFDIYNEIKNRFSKIKTDLGETTVVLTDARIGTLYDGVWQKQNNSVPDFAEGTLDIRISKPFSEIQLENIIKGIVKKIHKEKFELKIEELREPSSKISQKKLMCFTNSAKEAGFDIELGNPALGGYNDVAILSDKIKVPFIGFGPYGENNHTKDEWVSLQSIKDTKEVFKKFIKNI